MSTTTTIGSIRITALSDGTSHLPPMFYPGLDFSAHPGLLDAAGMYQIPTGTFLIEGEGFTILVDAGAGPDSFPFPPDLADAAGLADPPQFICVAGHLPRALEQAGVAPGDIDILFLTHLHPDHIGWVAPGGTLFFPRAQVVYGAADWDALIETSDPADPGRVGMEAARDAGVLRALEEPNVEIAPGVSAHHTPGHTPGHYVLSIESQGQVAYLLGDAVHHPLQLTEDGITFLSDADAASASETRERLFADLAAKGAVIGADHFPGLDFQHITADGAGRRWTPAEG